MRNIVCELPKRWTAGLLAVAVLSLPWLGTARSVHAAGPEPVKIRVELTDQGFNGQPGDFNIEVYQGQLIELTFVFANIQDVSDVHAIELKDYNITTDEINYYNRETTIKFTADKVGTFDFACVSQCDTHDLLQRGHLVVKPNTGGAAGPAAGRSQEATAIGVSAPGSAKLGQTVVLKALLVGAGGVPIPKANVSFVSPTTFLNTRGDMVIAEAVTDQQGIATAKFRARQNGPISVTATFAGDLNYAAAKASTRTAVTGSRQLYKQQVGVAIPGLNASPSDRNNVDDLAHWALSGWPIAAALLLIWSLYGTAVLFMSRIAALANEPAKAGQVPETEAGP